MTELFKILEGMAPDYLSELFVKQTIPMTQEINVN